MLAATSAFGWMRVLERELVNVGRQICIDAIVPVE
jgi:hypothetical protein